MPKPEPSKIERKLSTLLIGVDTLCGGDALHESGAHHMIADAWFSGTAPPEIYYDPFSQAARDRAQGKEGVPDVLSNADLVNEFVARYRLRDLSAEIVGSPTKLGQDHRTNLYNLSDALSMILNTVLAQINGKPLPSYDARYFAATANTVDVVEEADPHEAREHLRECLAQVGFEVTSGRNLRETVLAWKAAQKPLDPEAVAATAQRINTELLGIMRSNVFSHLNFGIPGYGHDLSDVAFDGHRFETISGVHFTGSSMYQGGEKAGHPALRGLFEYNIDHSVTEVSLYHLCAHEVMGHYLNSAVQDLLWRNEKLGFFVTMATMCTPASIFQEGWAQNMFELLYHSREAAAEVHGKDLLVALAHADLEDVGKHNASILYQRDGEDLDEVRRHLAEDCVQADPIVKKLSGAWAQHPIIGPMYGPAYLMGRRIVQDAIARHGNLSVARIGFHLDGYVDIATFQAKADRLSLQTS